MIWPLEGANKTDGKRGKTKRNRNRTRGKQGQRQAGHGTRRHETERDETERRQQRPQQSRGGKGEEGEGEGEAGGGGTGRCRKAVAQGGRHVPHDPIARTSPGPCRRIVPRDHPARNPPKLSSISRTSHQWTRNRPGAQA